MFDKIENFRLKEIRKERKLNQNDIAEILDVNRATIAKWELGTKVIPLERLNTLSNYLDLSMDYILGISDKSKEFNKIDEINLRMVGKKIKYLRSENNLIQSKLASILDIANSTMWSYENGDSLILTIHAYKLCKLYNLSLDYLCGKND